MEEKKSKAQGFCDYHFEILKVQGACYRVPVLDNSNVGKIYENKNNFVENPEDEKER